mmetsp:Transcript_12534/g.35522  ORF Transcript_12534/g.35522 Transcript_12534/m.35522 type:complete len:296 (+) Transcript_12534:261-1148(+)
MPVAGVLFGPQLPLRAGEPRRRDALEWVSPCRAQACLRRGREGPLGHPEPRAHGAEDVQGLLDQGLDLRHSQARQQPEPADVAVRYDGRRRRPRQAPHGALHPRVPVGRGRLQVLFADREGCEGLAGVLRAVGQQNLDRVAVVPVVQAADAHLVVAGAVRGAPLALGEAQGPDAEGEEGGVEREPAEPRDRHHVHRPAAQAGPPEAGRGEHHGQRHAPEKEGLGVSPVGGDVALPLRAQVQVPHQGDHEEGPHRQAREGPPGHARGEEEQQAAAHGLHHVAHVVVPDAHPQGLEL